MALHDEKELKNLLILPLNELFLVWIVESWLEFLEENYQVATVSGLNLVWKQVCHLLQITNQVLFQCAGLANDLPLEDVDEVGKQEVYVNLLLDALRQLIEEPLVRLALEDRLSLVAPVVVEERLDLLDQVLRQLVASVVLGEHVGELAELLVLVLLHEL